MVQLGDKLDAVLARYALPGARVGRRLSASGALAAVGEYERAGSLIEQAKRSFAREVASDPRLFRLAALDFTCTEGVVTFHKGQYGRAVAELERCMEVRRSEGFDNSDSDALVIYKMLGRAYEELGDLESAIKAYSAAVLIYERIRGSFRVSDRTMFFQRVVRSIYQGLIRTLSIKAEKSGSSAAFLAALQASERLRARQLGEILGGSRMPSPTSLDRLRGSIGTDGVLLSYTLTETEIVVLGLSAEGHAVAIRRCQNGECERKILSAAANLADSASLEANVRERLADVTELLLRPVEHLVRSKRRIVVVPDGLMNVIPLDMLYGPAERTPLLLDRVVRVLPALAVMEVDGGAARRRDAVQILAVGDPTYGGPRVPGGAPEREAIEAITRGEYHVYFASLPETRSEVEAIGILFGEEAVRVLVGSNASESTIKTMNLTGFQYLHFATHGILDRDVPGIGEPALVLAQEDGEDGFLTASEVEQLKLDADLTVLSACNTGRGSIVSGEGVIGLARAFMAAGSRAVIVSLWEVESKATELLMRHFYSSLKAGHDPAEALRLAKLVMMTGSSWEEPPRLGEESTRRASTQYGHPYYWSGFIAVQRR